MSAPSVTLSYTEVGSGPPLVITHGLFGMGRNWTPIANQLAEHFQVFLVDLRNHGDSPWCDDMNYPLMANDLATFITTHDLKEVTLIGHSMGGKAAMTLALTQPELIARLVVADIAPVAYAHEFETILTGMRGLDLTSISRRSEAQKALGTAIDDPALAGFLMMNLKQSATSGYQWGINLEALDQHMDDLLDFPDFDSHSTYEGPTLFLAGAQSTYIQPYHHAEIERLFPGASIEFIADAGHWVHAEKPALVAEKIAAFLRS